MVCLSMQVSVEDQGPLAAGWEKLQESIKETTHSRASTVQSLMNITADSYDEVLAESAAGYLLDYLNDREYPQEIEGLLAETLDFQGLSSEAACKRIR